MSTEEDKQPPSPDATGETAQDADNSQPDESTLAHQSARRSSRLAANSASRSPDLLPSRRAKKLKITVAKKTMTELRRNPKRKASEPVKHLGATPSELLQEALRPLEQKEIEEWEGWIEMESEPVS